ncbi:MAG: hypothetical protein HGA85_08835 [Nanoarchaeota archaeon]|nr:hypothetical protein [Nanoarchaeota archaeon]
MRELGSLLGLDKALLSRHPFPGPGLAIRCLCSDKEGIGKNTTQGTVLPVRSVGVQGDERTYRSPLVVLSSKPWEELERESTQSTNSDKEINRVLLQAYPKETSEFRMIKAGITKERLDLLRKADSIVNEFCIEKGIYDKIWQFPVVLLPVLSSGKPVIVLRPITSIDAMTASFYRFDRKLLDELCARLRQFTGAVLYDITNKPPATIEWE